MFETVKVVNKAVRQRSGCHSPGLPGSSPLSTHSSSSSSTPRTSCFGSDNTSFTPEDRLGCGHAQKEDSRCVYCIPTGQAPTRTPCWIISISAMFVAAFATADQSAWASPEHREVRTWKQPYAACQPVSRTTHLNGPSLMWSVSGNFTSWHQCVMRPNVPVAFSRQTTAWCPVQQHQQEPTTPTAALGTPVAPLEDPGPTCQTVYKS